MLPLSRVIPALLLGVGVASVSAGVAAPVFLDARPAVPLDLEDTTWTIVDESATTRLFQDGRQLNVPVTAQWHLNLQEPADEDTTTVRIGSSLMRSSQQSELERLIQAQVWTYPIDRITRSSTGVAEVSHTIGMPSAGLTVDGVWFLFPADAEKTTYEVFDETLRGTAPAVFDREEKIDGHTIYVYRQEIAPTNVATRYASLFNVTEVAEKAQPAPPPAPAAPEGLPETPGDVPEPPEGLPETPGDVPEPPEGLPEAPEGLPDEPAPDTPVAPEPPQPQKGYLHHSATRDFFVDQRTGLVVDMDVQVHDFYATAEGAELENSLTFSGSISEADTAQLLEQTKKFPNPALIRTVRLTLIIGGGLLTIVSALGAFGLVARKRRAVSTPAGEGQAVPASLQNP
ncbi:porin PorA family protein [Corynebacterium phocae]|uniref:porin PorA family protein n=1 Tax=Corynebacterium phocae TaxID=161895 RepID=UPI000951E787|nr:porin PorA family protein [Corynebacterium phocae]KAA8721602.1 DUF3068 domain-containing protein [Corynebacterium phocae]